MIYIPSVIFPFRLIFDSAFYNEVLKESLKKNPSSPPLTTKLFVINDKAKGLSRDFNTMSKKIFDDIVAKGMPRNRLRAMFMPADEYTIELINDEVERTIKHAINVASTGQVNKSMIMTSDAKRKEYEENMHFKSIKLLSIESGMKCVDIINDFYKRVERT